MARNGAIWAAQTIANGTSGVQAQWWEIGNGNNSNLAKGTIYAENTIGPSGYNIVNPSIGANTNCTVNDVPFCDALVGFTTIATSASENTTYMSSGYQLEPEGSVGYYTQEAYEGGIGPYQNKCATIQTGNFSSTGVDSYAYPGDMNFFTTQQYSGVKDTSSGCATAIYDWGLSWAQVPNT